MLKRIRAVENDVFAVRVDDGVFTLTQYRGNSYYEFFDIFFTEPEAGSFLPLDLNRVDVLMTLSCAGNKFKNFFLRREEKALPNQRPVESSFLSIGHMLMRSLVNDADTAPDNGPLAVSLIKYRDLLKEGCSYEVLIERVDAKQHEDVVNKYQFGGMLGDSVKLQQQLRRYVQEGVLWCKSKEYAFSDAKPRVRAKPDIHAFADLL